MDKIIIVAMANNRLIGNKNTMPWNIPEELKLFKKITVGSTVIMGRKTYESIGNPLPNRNNIVVSRTLTQNSNDNITACNSIEMALEKAYGFKKDIFFIGGANIYKQALPIADYIYLSFLNDDYEGDTYFPEFNMSDYKVIEQREYEQFIFYKLWKIRKDL